MNLLLGLFWLGASLGPAAAEEAEWFAREWQSDDGLPENTVVGVAQTPDGFLWVATANALVRFDGVEFRQVPFTDPAPVFRGENAGLIVDRQGRLWLIKQRGAAVRIDGEEVLSLTTRDGLPDAVTDSFVLDGDDNLWLSVLDSRVVCYQNGIVRRIGAGDGFPSGPGKCWLGTDVDGVTWFSTQGKVGVWRDDQFNLLLDRSPSKLSMGGQNSPHVWILDQWELLKFEEGSPPVRLGKLELDRPDTAVTTLYEDRGGALWIGTQHSGLFRYDDSGFTSIPTSRKDILCVTEDEEGSIWVGTQGGGLNRLRHRVLQLHDMAPAAPFNQVLSACQDQNGDFWAAMEAGPLVRRSETGWETVLGVGPETMGPVKCVAADPKEGIWVGTRDSGLLFWNQGIVRQLGPSQGLASRYVRSLLVTPSGDVWIGSDISHVALQRLRGEKLQAFELPVGSGPVSAMALDSTGRFWAGTTDGSLLGLVDERLVNETPDALVPPRAIQSLCATPDGSLWVGYAGAGLGRLKDGQFTRFGAEQGLRDDYIAQVVTDGWGELWWAGNRGVFHGSIEEFDAVSSGHIPRVQSVLYGYEDGVETVQASRGFWPGSFRDDHGVLWFPLLTGLLSVDVDSAIANPVAPPVVILRAIVDDQVVVAYTYDELHRVSPEVTTVESRQGELQLRLTPEQSRLRVEFAALSYVSPGNVAFKYMLEGLDEDWVDVGHQRVVDLIRLPPGDYRFRVIGSNNDGVWTRTGSSLAIVVIPSFWQTGWFITLVSLSTLAGATGMIRYLTVRRMHRQLEQLEHERAVERERTRIAKDIHDDLGANLTEITLLSELSLEDDVPEQEVQADLRKIAAKARQLTSTIADIVWAVNPQHDALDSFISYACTYAEDYLRSAHIRCRLDIAPDLPAIPLPAAVRHNLFLTLKEALNNVVKHASASEVVMRMTPSQTGFRLTLVDNGCGFDTQTVQAVDEVDRRGYGLFNMRKRVEEVGGTFKLYSQPGQGTRIELALELYPE